MSSAASDFWAQRDDYHELVETFERGIEVQHPDYVTSRSMCTCLDYVNRCGFPLNGKAEYYEYNGPSIL